jgi:Acyltransferase family
MTRRATPVIAPPLGGEILNLQFLRGAAAMLVVACHLIERLVKRDLYPIEYRDLAWSLGEVGVATFFAISGFIMVHTTLDGFGDRGKAVQFIRRRFFRIAPLYYLTTLGMVIFKSAVDSAYSMPSFGEIAKSLAFVPYQDSEGLMRPVYGLGWTLEYEMYFYLLFAVCMCFWARIGLAVVILVLCLQVGFGSHLVEKVGAHTELGVIIAYFAEPIVLYFVIGIAIAVFFRISGGPSETPLPDAALCTIGFLVMLGDCRDCQPPRSFAVAQTIPIVLQLLPDMRRCVLQHISDAQLYFGCDRLAVRQGRRRRYLGVVVVYVCRWIDLSWCGLAYLAFGREANRWCPQGKAKNGSAQGRRGSALAHCLTVVGPTVGCRA